MRRTRIALVWGVFFTLVALGESTRAAEQFHAEAAPVETAAAARPTVTYQVFAFNDLGMHCYDSDFSVFTLLPPFNTIHAQVVQRGARARLCTGSDVTCTYRAVADATGSINSTSLGKTNFWTNSKALFGVSRVVDVGILGSKMPGLRNSPQSLTYEKKLKWFSAVGIPITDQDDSLHTNTYPMLRIDAGKRGKAASTSLKIVTPVSSEMGCAECHVTGANAASPDHVMQYNIVFSSNSDPKIQYRENILILHDAMYGTKLMKSRPVLCASCHYSPALDLAGKGPNATQQKCTTMSRAIHRHHGRTIDHALPDNPNSAIIPEAGAQSCYKCHPGTVTNCLRSVMSMASIVCQDCHGGLLQVAGELASSDSTRRRPWADLPKCQSCHTGDAVSHLGSDLRLKKAYSDANLATPTLASNKRFAENDGKLYRFSTGHGGLACAACHGSPHTEWPARDPNSNDNVAAQQIQGHTGPIVECKACHATPPSANLNGPHGMHPVDDKRWIFTHEDFVESSRSGVAACETCHGQDLRGTPLSKTSDDRIFFEGTRHAIPTPAGTPIGCVICHEGQPGGDG